MRPEVPASQSSQLLALTFAADPQPSTMGISADVTMQQAVECRMWTAQHSSMLPFSHTIPDWTFASQVRSFHRPDLAHAL